MRKLIHTGKKLSLRGRLILSSILCVLLPSILSFILTNYLIQEELVERAVEQSEDSLEVLDLQMTVYFDQLLYISNYIQFNDQLKSILNRTIERAEQLQTTPESEALDTISIERSLEGVTNLLVPVYLTIMLENGYTYTNFPITGKVTQHVEELYRQKRTHKYYGFYWNGVHPNYVEAEKEKYPYLISIARVINLSEKSNAFQLISIHEQDIRSLLKERTFDNQQDIMLVDSNGMVVSHNKNELVEKQFPFKDEVTDDGTYQIVSYNDQDYLMVSRSYSYGDWNIVSLIPYKTAVGNIQTVTSNSLFFQLFFFMVFLLILVLLVRQLTKPLMSLNKVIKEVEKGHLSVRTNMTGSGDIEQLGHSLDMMMDEIEQMIKHIKQVENSKRMAEIEMLQAQINPHFLFNMLNSLRLKILLNGDRESSKLIQSLSLLLRMTINRNNEYIALGKEIEVIEHYLNLMNFKSRSNIDLEIDLEQSTLDLEVPRFFLQPLVENSIIHGFDEKSGRITITSRLEPNGMLISVTDNGKGFTQEDLQRLRLELQTADTDKSAKRNKSSFTGIGIKNVFQRMRLIYGEEFQMKVENQPSGGTQILFYIPSRK